MKIPNRCATVIADKLESGTYSFINNDGSTQTGSGNSSTATSGTSIASFYNLRIGVLFLCKDKGKLTIYTSKTEKMKHVFSVFFV